MITQNHAKNQDLYDRAIQVLQEKGSGDYKNITEIKNIDEYFNCLQELVRIENEYKDEVDPIFTMLPTTEETFKINANTREITTPPAFK